ncbi:MAG: hypothetical protein ACKOX6_07245 [Bdellovibrio sp.]
MTYKLMMSALFKQDHAADFGHILQKHCVKTSKGCPDDASLLYTLILISTFIPHWKAGDCRGIG